LLPALEKHNWSAIYYIPKVDKAHNSLVKGIRTALNVVAPIKAIKVRVGANLYLSRDTLGIMRARDNAKGKAGYRQLQNRVSVLV
jgi:hypothetical protein